MAKDATFYEQPIDRTPYTAFTWVIAIAVLVVGAAGYGVWKAGGLLKSHTHLSINDTPGATDALLNNIQNQGASALDQAKSAAEQAAKTAADNAAAAATQQLLQQSNAAIKSGETAAQNQAQTQVQNQAQADYQKYLNQ